MYRWLIGAAAVALVYVGLYAAHDLGYQAGEIEAESRHQAERAEAEHQARVREQQWAAEKHKLEERHAENQRASAAAAASARNELDRLRHILTSRRPAPVAAPAQPLPAGTGEAERELLGQCAAHLQGVAAEADRLSDKVTGLQQYVRGICLSQQAPYNPQTP